MSDRHWSQVLVHMGACDVAVTFARQYRSFRAAWVACERPEWLLWYAGRVAGPPESESRRRLVLAACDCAATALRYVPSGETRPKDAIAMARRWARGEGGVTLNMVRSAASAAAAARSASDAYPASAAGFAAAAAASAAGFAAAAADSAACAAADAALRRLRPADSATRFAAADSAASAARFAARRRLCRIIRRHYPVPPRRKGAR